MLGQVLTISNASGKCEFASRKHLISLFEKCDYRAVGRLWRQFDFVLCYSSSQVTNYFQIYFNYVLISILLHAEHDCCSLKLIWNLLVLFSMHYRARCFFKKKAPPDKCVAPHNVEQITSNVLNRNTLIRILPAHSLPFFLWQLHS